MARKIQTYMRFLCAGLLRQQQTGAIVPSQRFLVDRMLEPIPDSYTGKVVELGAGTGALTMRLVRKCPKARVLACEINPVLAKELRWNLDSMGINGQVEIVSEPAERVLSAFTDPAVRKPDYIVSGIPLGNVPRRGTLALIDQISNSLGKGGMYIQFQHSLLDRRKIQVSFADLRTVPVLLNFPPGLRLLRAKVESPKRRVISLIAPPDPEMQFCAWMV